ncbi:hypothetical protein N8988_06640 [Opitutales bacterium]|nr:hypothetical protein [Opitutales bacterium]
MVLSIMIALPLSGQGVSMTQGKHKIIVKSAENIKENLAQVKQSTELVTRKVQELSVLEQNEFSKSEDADLSQRQRQRHRHLARSLDHRADVYMQVRNLASQCGDRLAQVENSLSEIERTLANSPYLADDPETMRSMAQVGTSLAKSMEMDSKLSLLAGRAALNGGISSEARRIYRLSQGQLASAIRASSSDFGRSRSHQFRKQIDDLRDSVRSRRTRLSMIEKVTDRSLREIEVFAATQATRVIFDDIDGSLEGIAPDDDPLGLEILRPEANERYWQWHEREEMQRSANTHVLRPNEFVPVSQRINPNQL